MILACPRALHSLLTGCIPAFMSIFGKKTAAAPLEEPQETLNQRLTRLESDMRMLQIEYLDTHDKMKRLMSRVAKRAAIDADTINDQPVLEVPASPGMDPISAKIHARRGDGGHF